MTVFVIADTHFYHKNIMEYEPIRKQWADDIPSMNEYLVRQWNSVVTPEDTVIHLGDVSFGNKEQTKDLMDRLNGRKVLVMGNHDTRSKGWFLSVGFQEVHKETTRSFKTVETPPNVIFSHQPITEHLGAVLNVHGHCHSRPRDGLTPLHACVSVELNNGVPVELGNLLKGVSNV